MVELIPYAEKSPSIDPYEGLLPPPDDPVEGNHWVNTLLRRQLWAIINDPSLGEPERRSLILKYANQINKTTPHEELFKAREEIRGDEKAVEGTALQGTVTRRATKRIKRRHRSE